MPAWPAWPLIPRCNGGERPAPLGGYVFERLRLCESAQLLQALVLDLPDPFTRHVERPPDLVECPGVLAVEPVPQLEHSALARREAVQHTPERGLPQLLLRDLVGEGLVLVGQEVPELGLFVVTDGLLQRHRRL